jgi:hypothetical protein
MIGLQLLKADVSLLHVMAALAMAKLKAHIPFGLRQQRSCIRNRTKA